MGKIYARQIHDGKMTLADVPEIWVQATKDAYFEIYGEHLEEEKPVSGTKKKRKK